MSWAPNMTVPIQGIATVTYDDDEGRTSETFTIIAAFGDHEFWDFVVFDHVEGCPTPLRELKMQYHPKQHADWAVRLAGGGLDA